MRNRSVEYLVIVVFATLCAVSFFTRQSEALKPVTNLLTTTLNQAK